MEVIDFELEVAEVSIAEGLAFDDLDLVVEAFHFCRREGER